MYIFLELHGFLAFEDSLVGFYVSVLDYEEGLVRVLPSLDPLISAVIKNWCPNFDIFLWVHRLVLCKIDQELEIQPATVSLKLREDNLGHELDKIIFQKLPVFNLFFHRLNSPNKFILCGRLSDDCLPNALDGGPSSSKVIQLGLNIIQILIKRIDSPLNIFHTVNALFHCIQFLDLDLDPLEHEPVWIAELLSHFIGDWIGFETFRSDYSFVYVVVRVEFERCFLVFF